MKTKRDRRYFIVKHDLRSFQALPGVIWRTGAARRKPPHNFNQVKIGDRWVEFAHILDGIDEEPCSLVTGFCECIREARYGVIPSIRRSPAWQDGWDELAWMIEGKPVGRQPRHKPVGVPSIDTMLGRTVFKQGAIIPGIAAEEFEHIREVTLQNQLVPDRIPLLRRPPQNEQEVLSIVVAGHSALGIQQIINVQTRFPDMLVSIDGQETYLELEYDSLGFLKHWNDLRPLAGRRGWRDARLKDRDDYRPVAVLCWTDGGKNDPDMKCIRNLRVFELKSLIRDRQKIHWR